MKLLDRRMLSLVPAVLALIGACSQSTTSVETPPVSTDGHTSTITSVRGNLTFVVTDSSATPGFLFALPSVDVGPQRLIVRNTRYGSLCIYDVQGAATQSERHIAIDVTFSERLTSCAAEVRALRYTATLTGLSGAYDVDVIHHENGRADTLRHVSVTVP